MSRLLTITFTTAVFRTEAAYGSLKPPPTRRLRGAHLHLSYSMALARLLDTIPTTKHAREENIPEPDNEAKIVHRSTSVGDSSRIPSPWRPLRCRRPSTVAMAAAASRSRSLVRALASRDMTVPTGHC